MEQQQTKNKKHQKEILLYRRLSLLLMLLAFAGISLSFYQNVYYSLIGFSIFFIFIFATLFIRKSRSPLFMIFSYAIFPHFFFLFPDIFEWISKSENYFAVSLVFNGLTLFPLLLLREKQHSDLLRIALIVNMIFILFYDILVAIDEGKVLSIWILNTYLYYKVPQVMLWIITVWAFRMISSENEAQNAELRRVYVALSDADLQVKKLEKSTKVLIDDFEEQKQKAAERFIKLSNLENELNKTKLAFVETMDRLKGTEAELKQSELEKENIWRALNDYYLVAQYDLRGNPEKINEKAAEWLGKAGQQTLKKMVFSENHSGNGKKNKSLNGKTFNEIWEKLKKGESKTLDISINFGDNTKYLTATFTPLYDSNNKPHRILAIGHDITEMVEQNARIDEINAELSEKVKEISEKNKMMSFQQLEIFEKNEELSRQKEEIEAINESLEERVRERTEVLEKRNKQLTEYAFINSHILRSPVSTMIGLINLMSYSDLPEKDKMLYEHLKSTANVLDEVIHKINNAIDSRIHFDREYVDPERRIRPV